MNKKVLMFGVWALPPLGLACGGGAPDHPAAASDPAAPSPEYSSAYADRIQALDFDLVMGSSGDDVVAVHAYLARYGYFPNEGIMRVFPAWRPLVAEGPASPSTYDEHTAEAVKHYQTVYGIPVTGIVDAKTREMMRMPRCGRPDGPTSALSSADPSDKFAIIDKFWGNQVNWLFKGTLPGDPLMTTMARQATYDWQAQTSLHFTEITLGSYDMSITFGSLPCWPGFCDQSAWASTSPPDITGNHSDITVNSSKRFYYGYGAVPQDGLSGDFYSIILHEVGHAIGLDHSSVGGPPVMFPGISTGETRRVLTVDDKVAISSLYDQWEKIDDTTKDVGVGSGGDVWAIDTADNAVWKWENRSWFRVNANASRIAVGTLGWPYVIAGWGDGTIWKRPSNWHDDTVPPGWSIPVPWVQLPGGGCGRDIGVGPEPDGSDGIWVIGCDSGPDGTIWKFNGSGWTQDQSGGAAANISVGSDGRPWVTTSTGEVYQYSSNDPLTGGWSFVSGPRIGSVFAVDIGVGPALYPYIAEPSSGNAYVLDWQYTYGDGSRASGAPSRREWRKLPSAGRGAHLAAGPNGEAFVSNNAGQLYHQLK